MRKIPSWVITLFIFAASFPLFFFKLGQSSLVSWDEAWYASIAANLLKTGDMFRLWFNGAPFFDHPPFGFWLIALSFKIFGVNEFWARAPSALFGILTLIATYLLGSKLFGKLVGFLSATALATSPWVIYRARSGNLDIFLTAFFIISIYLAVLALEDRRYLNFLAVSIAILLITKTLIPFAIFPALIYLFWKGGKYKFRDFGLPIIIVFLPFVSWFLVNAMSYPNFIGRFFFVGAPGVTVHPNFISNILLIKIYLHEGIGIWFWPAMLSFMIAVLFRKRTFNFFLIVFLAFVIPFVFSQKAQIWHFTPIHPILILNLLGTASILLGKIFRNRILIVLILLIPTLYYAYRQGRQNWYGFIDIPSYTSDEAVLSREAGKYNEKFYIDGDFLPAAAFYSNKIVSTITGGTLTPLFESNEKFVLITKQWRLDQAGIKLSQYRVLKTDRDKILLDKI